MSEVNNLTNTNTDNTPLHWREAQRLPRTSFLFGVKLTKAMRTTEGLIREFTRKLAGVEETISIRFDEEYTFDRFLRDVLEPLGYVQNGQLHPDFVNGYLKRFTEWLATAGIEEQRSALYKEAQRLSEVTGRSVDECFDFLGGNKLGQPIEDEPESVPVPTANGGRKSKEAAKV